MSETEGFGDAAQPAQRGSLFATPVQAAVLLMGAVFLMVGVLGFIPAVTTDQDSCANFVPVNTADNWLHFALGLGMVVLGLLLPRLRDGPGAGSNPVAFSAFS